ncbi:AfsR/SARP family transcriptional regulator [Stackebrandtia nassauensis]|uniref:Transcriptional regulator, SARP family n=1 Tax=Stackebrandtia nassauensis (strain DSM 44728 / CIP 108903 / NRRL B-16338 / NBRC 102104 / LLR-40K-21) TaxID=446470 RepID=D3Q859_STANL|nr:BTAD domain-containing putative transcriptional regulator [Stackebrandtia nassauensis]ADD40564.1 transcriptional regulator, SARP family [Stackebrandtia nassauensis DSM 44728]
MEYRILGPLEVVRDGVPIAIKGRHQPRLLAMLLLEAGQTVTLSRLVDVLWDEEPPETARRQAQNYMAALRRTLGTSNPIEVVGEGYRFAAGDSFVDSVRFEELNHLARHDAREGRHAKALPSFDEALGLWRGPTLAGLSARWLESRSRRLDDLRLGMIEDRAASLLELGRHADVVGELAELLAEKPYRQQAARHLMLALYRCGRGAEALEVFGALRTRLAEELGIDPNPMVRELHGRILREDASLAVPRPEMSIVAAKPEILVPAQLPAGVATFTGRDEELAELDRLFDSGAAVTVLSAISGGGGVGKTALAVHWSRNRTERFPDGQLYVNLRGFDHNEPLKPIDALSRFLRALGTPSAKIPAETEEASALFRSVMNGRNMLVVLDNARTAEQVRPLLPGGQDNAVLVTSRNRLASLAALNDAKLMALDVLSLTESLELLAELIGADRVNADPDSARRLVELCGHLPLALRIAAASLAARSDGSISNLASELDSVSRLEILSIEGDPYSAVTATFDLSVGALSIEARDLFLRLGMIPGEDIAEGLAVEVSGHQEDRAKDLLQGLVSAHLLETHVPGRYRFHDLVRIYAHRCAIDKLSSSICESIIDTLVAWYFQNRGRISPDEIPNVVTTCKLLNKHPEMWRVAYTLSMITHHGLGLKVARDQCEIALRIAEVYNDRHGQARMLSALGGIQYALGETELSIELSRKSVATIDPNVDSRTYGDLCNNLGIRLSWSGRYREAEEWLVKSLQPGYMAEGVHFELVRVLNLGTVYRALGRYGDALAYLDRSAALLSKLESRSIAASIYLARALLENDRGRHRKAWAYAQEALLAGQQCKSVRSIVIALQQRGLAEFGCGKIERAREDYLASTVRANEHGMSTVERRNYCFLADLECFAGDNSRAVKYLESAAAVEVLQPPRYLVAEMLRVDSNVRLKLNAYRHAVSTGRKAAALFASMPDPLRHARSLVIVARAYEGLADYNKAADARQEALAIFTRLGVPETAVLRAEIDAHS